MKSKPIKRVRVKIGDLFLVDIPNSKTRFFQYVTKDSTQLNSDLIRVFKKEYSSASNPDLLEVANGEVEFYAHVFIRVGIKFHYWRKVGNVADVGRTDISFRWSNDIGDPKAPHPLKWFIWKVNQPTQRVGELSAKERELELGLVFSPDDILHRLCTGSYRACDSQL